MKTGGLPPPIDRAAPCGRLREPREWGLVIIGSGATGLSVALDAAARGYAVVCVDSNHFAKGTSPRDCHGSARRYRTLPA
jgi:glycerol-3-phosphate dehydrogenase